MNYPHQKIEVCFSPAIYKAFHNPDSVVVVTDIFRATTAIVTAFMNRADQVIPVGTLEEAYDYKQRGYIVAAERDGLKKDFADFGNSPFNFTKEKVEGQTIVYSTTNGTQAIHLAQDTRQVIIGAFINLTAMCDYLKETGRDVVVLCAGWKSKFSLEDTVHAGAIVEQMLLDARYSTICDSSLAALDLWRIAKPDLIGYLDKCAQRSRLRKNNLDDVIEYCLTPDITSTIPILHHGRLIDKSLLSDPHI